MPLPESSNKHQWHPVAARVPWRTQGPACDEGEVGSQCLGEWLGPSDWVQEGASTRLCTYDLPRLCTCDSPRLCTYDFLVDAIRMPASCAMGHSNVLVLDMHVLFGTKMFALLLGSMVFCIVNAKHVELLRQDGFDLRVEKSCLSSLTGILLCCMCNLSCEFFTQKFCQRHWNLVVEMLVITTLMGV